MKMNVFLVVGIIFILLGVGVSVYTRPSPQETEAEQHPAPGDLYACIHHGVAKDDGSVSDPFLAFFRIVRVEGDGVWHSSQYLHPSGKTTGSDWYQNGVDTTPYLHATTVESVRSNMKTGYWTLIVPPEPKPVPVTGNDAQGPNARAGRDGEVMVTVSGQKYPQWVPKPATDK